MWNKAKELTTFTPLSFTVLSQINPGKLGLIFSSMPPGRELEKHQQIPTKKAKEDLHQMLDRLPKEKDFVHRGMAGYDEVKSIVTHDKFGAGKYTKRPDSLDIAEFVHKPESCLLLSTSPDPYTVSKYMVGFQLLTATGAITSMCLPGVYIRPQTARHIDVETFRIYQNKLDDDLEAGLRASAENIFDLAEGNNETTVVLGASKEDDWRPQFNRDLHSIILVKGAGRILSGFTNANTLETTTIINPNFCKRVMAIEIFSTYSGKGALFNDSLKTMTRRAQELGLIARDQRVLTIDDAQVLMNSKEYQELIEKYKAIGETLILNGVPKNIPVGSEEVVQYAISLINEYSLKEEYRAANPSMHL
ncbi:hypothetical protein [Legionella sp. WA2022007384]